MSQTTNIILSFPTGEKDFLTKVNKYFEKRYEEDGKPGRGLVLVEGIYMQVEIAMGSFNYLRMDELKKHLNTIQIENEILVELLYREELFDSSWQGWIVGTNITSE